MNTKSAALAEVARGFYRAKSPKPLRRKMGIDGQGGRQTCLVVG